MTNELWPVLSHSAGESPTSFLSRLAALHATRMREFCRDLGLVFQGIVDGSRHAVIRLAHLARASADDLLDQAIVRTGERAYEWRGEQLTRMAMRRNNVMVCPLCLRDDLESSGCAPGRAAFGRTIWQLQPIQTCGRHNVALVRAAHVEGPGFLHDFAANVGPYLRDLDTAAASCEERSPSSLETYLLARLTSPKRLDGWLDGLAWHAAADACHMIGAVVLHGRDVKIKVLSEGDWHAAGGAGHNIAMHGAAGVREFLRDLDRSYPRSRPSTEGPQALYGALFKWLAETTKQPALDPVRDLIVNHAVDTMPLGPEDVLFGKRVEARVLHSVRSASIEWEIHPKRLRKILVESGLIGADAAGETDERALFNASAAQEILEKTARSLSQKETEIYLNAGRVHTKLLATAGFIRPFATKAMAGKGSKHTFAVIDLDLFLRRLLADAETATAGSPNEFDIPKASKRANCSAMEIVRLIIDRKMAWVGRKADAEGYLSVVVRLDEVKSHVHGPKVEGWTARGLEKELRTTTKVVKALITNGHLATYKVVNPVNRCPVILIADEEVAQFRAKFVSLHELARGRGAHFRVVQAALRADGISPALPHQTYGATFYHRSDIV